MNQFLILKDSELITEFLNGSNEAMEWLVQRHKDKWYAFILAKVKDKHHAEDIFQDFMIRIIGLLRKGQYTDTDRFAHWAKHIAFNMCIDHHRRKKRSKLVTNGHGHDFFDKFHFSEEGADRKLINRERRDMIASAIKALPENQRRVIMMRHYVGSSFREIAGLDHCSVNTALGRMRYGLMNMRKLIGEKAVG